MIDSIINSINTHPTTWCMITAYVALAAVNALPAPGTDRPLNVLVYQWMYDFLHALSNRVVQKYPQMSVPATNSRQEPLPVPVAPKGALPNA